MFQSEGLTNSSQIVLRELSFGYLKIYPNDNNDLQINLLILYNM